jgi:ubiquinone/menaquinone biosynthesis C-methylase UbiE
MSAHVNESTDAYDRWHEQLAHDDERPTATAPWHGLAKKYLGDVAGLRVLEIGCGRGAFALELADRGASVVAADFSPSAVDRARELVGDSCETLVADIQQIPFPDESFDLVVSLETLEHVPDPDRGLAELVRVTKRGGRLIVTTPNYLSLVGLYRVALRLVGRRFTELGQPINQPLMLHRRVRKLKQLGCRIEAVDGTHHLLPVPGVGSIRLRHLEHPQRVMKWFELHGLTAARRL